MAEKKQKTPYNFVGKSGLRVSNICLGTMTFGSSAWGDPSNIDEAASHQIMDRYTEYGGNFIDTADLYGHGKSEEVVGNWLERQPRENFVVATKVRSVLNRRDVNNGGLNRRHIVASIDGSLKRLKTDYVDLYQIHGWDYATTLLETWRAFDDLVRCGKVRYLGVCNTNGWQMQQIVDLAERMGLHDCISLQQQYSLVCRESELEPFQVCKARGIGVLPWSPLKGGLLTGKIKRGKKPEEGRMKWSYDNNHKNIQIAPHVDNILEKHFDIVDAAEAIAKKKGVTTAQVSLRWCIQKDIVSSTIIGARTLKQLDDNMGANNFSLTKEEMDELDRVSRPASLYPYDSGFRLSRVNSNVPEVTVRSKY